MIRVHDAALNEQGTQMTGVPVRARAHLTGAQVSASPEPVPLPFTWADQQQHLVGHLSALVRLDTSNPPGNEIAVASYLSRELSRSGISYTVLEQGGHASIPRSDAAVFTLAEALLRLRAFAPESVLQPTSRRMLRTLAELHPGAGAQAIERLLLEPTWDRANSLPIDPLLRDFVVAGLHNTATPTLLSAGQRQNVVPTDASVALDGRLLPGERPEEWAQEVQQAVGDGVEVSLLQGRVSHVVHDDPEILRVLGETIAAQEPGARILPYINSASTDARAFPETKVIGFFPSASDADNHAAHPRSGRTHQDQ